MAYEDVATFIAKLRKREAISALALELCILTAARSGEIGSVQIFRTFDHATASVSDKCC
jgi:hypothetical protein